MTTTDDWVRAYAAAAGISPPSQDDTDLVLQLAAVAAHSSERTAAPITCWIAAMAGLSPADALALAESLEPEST
jgi:hypothetical protein